MVEQLEKGLEGVVAAESSLSSIDGEAGELRYRGYAIEDLARGATFEEVLHLLWVGHLPAADELETFSERMARERDVSPDLLETIERLARADERPMSVLRTAVSMLSAYEPEDDADPDDREVARAKSRRITAKIPTILAAYERIRRGEEPVEPDRSLGHAANFLYMLSDERPDELAVETFDQSLTLHADHGLNASTFTAMVIGSTMADIYAAVTGGIGALSGPLHGAANQDVMELLTEIDEGEEDPRAWIERATEEDRRIPGFGHRVYDVTDPRAHILRARSEELADRGDPTWYGITSTIESYLTTETDLSENGIAPNVDFYSGSVYYNLDIPIDMYTAIFAMSRVGGWTAHVLEYQADNRLIRPRGRYVGPDEREFVPIEER